jgi:hypothetical protein
VISSSLLTILALHLDKGNGRQREPSVQSTAIVLQGEVYSFHVNILQVRLPTAGSPKWKLLIIGEFWQSGEGESIHSTKWLKLLHGKPGDVLKWISANRASVSPSTSDSVKS